MSNAYTPFEHVEFPTFSVCHIGDVFICFSRGSKKLVSNRFGCHGLWYYASITDASVQTDNLLNVVVTLTSTFVSHLSEWYNRCNGFAGKLPLTQLFSIKYQKEKQFTILGSAKFCTLFISLGAINLFATPSLVPSFITD